ncbi:MAG: ribosomal-protein-alanine N-acetyltransferase [Myxococcota bacterium]|jgi:ribosomal-protein-alanine N-acetyltransferase
MLPTHLQTARLQLRPTELRDAEAIFARYAREPDVTRYMLWAPHANLDVTRAFVAMVMEPRAPADLTRVWGLTGDDGTAIGMLGAHQRAPFSLELAYVLAPAFRGQGLMAEAARSVIEAALEEPAIYRVFATSHIDNVASARVQEKAGMTFEGVLRRARVFPNLGPEPCDERIYATVRV